MVGFALRSKNGLQKELASRTERHLAYWNQRGMTASGRILSLDNSLMGLT